MVKRGSHYTFIIYIHEEDVTTENLHAPNIRARTYVKQILTGLKGEINSSTIIIGDYSTPLSTMDRLSRQGLNTERANLNNTIDKWT